MSRLAWGIIGTGNIAKTFAQALATSKTGKLLAVGSRSTEQAERFGTEHAVPRRYATYEDLLADTEVQAVYVSTPHPFHAEWAIKCAEAGKHVLCEKPLALNHPDAMAVVEAARDNDVFLMEAFMYRCHPQTARVVELVRSGAIGEVRVIQVTFSFQAEFKPESRLFKNSLGGGGILDVGCYCTSFARLIAGAARGKDFEDPVSLTGHGFIGRTGADEYAVASARFPGDIVATLATGVNLTQESVARIFGTEGSILVPDPWIPSREGGRTRIVLTRRGKKPEEIAVESSDWLYAIEADTVARNIEKRQAPSPAMSWDDSLGNMRALDAWRQSIGLVYDAEKPAVRGGIGALTVAGRALAVRKDAPMKHGRVPGVDKPVSRLVLGVDNQETFPLASVMFDHWFERGGNAFDTAYIYGGGSFERMLGHWVKSRGVRESVVIIGKGAHTPFCDPKHLSSQLLESLDRLQTDHVDIYLMHRDNLDVPVSEFVEVLNEHKRKGRMRVFGGSNWSLERIEEANAYARSKGLQGFTVLSNNLSLARMVSPVWAGCLHVSDMKSRDRLQKSGLILLPWSSQARGFFTDRAGPADTSDPELVRCWYAEENFRRRSRAVELAEKRGCLPIQIALAYVLRQSFPTFALIGPRTLHEMRISLAAIDLDLTQKEVEWLWGGDEG